jgi:large subunit ribosomal protein L29
MAKKKKDVRDLDEREITQQLTEMEEQMFRMRFQMSMGQTDGLKKIRVMRKERARLLTIRRERELVAVPAGAPVKVGK